MSELKVDKVSPRTGTYVSLNTVGSKNIVINGDMSIAQRATSATGIGNGDTGYHTCDRWSFVEGGSATGEFTQSQSTDVPTGQGFATSLKMDCTTADASLASDEFFIISQKFEGQNLQYLKKGTSSAESLTLSFWVKSNKTGTYIAELIDADNTRQISRAYTVDSASTWEKKTLTFEGDTTGSFDNDNIASLNLNFFLNTGSDRSSGTLNTSWNTTVNANRAVGQVNLADNTANEWLITGVQLEAGTTASDFEFLPFDINQQRCLRYYYRLVQGTPKTFGTGFYYTSSFVFSCNSYPVRMRTTPSLDQVSGTDYYDFLRNGATDSVDDFVLNTSGRTNEIFYEIFNATDASGTAGQAGVFRGGNASAYVAFDAEL